MLRPIPTIIYDDDNLQGSIMSMSEVKKFEDILLTIQKPGRYTGGEWNSVRKVWTDDKVKFLLAFPDLYEVAMSHLGIKILYGILNARQDALCERVFAPWADLEKALRENALPLSSLESRKAMKEFDIVGFSLAYELSYTNVLNMLDLGGIPLRSDDRSDEDPVVIAGGPCCYNPEPMADFIDAFVIGDGEEIIGEIVDAYKECRVQGSGFGVQGTGMRKRFLRKLSGIEGVYVPSLYRVEYNEDMTVKNFSPTEDGLPDNIKKRVIRDLDTAYYPTDQIVPNIQVVHDRITIEIMRGCKHACSFCQASAVYAPPRQRSKDTILCLAEETYERTGYDEISLLSLSSGDHSEIIGITKELNRIFKNRSVSISLPSLRVEDIAEHLPALVSEVKKSGLTFAPEAASGILRKSINKNIDMDKLFKAVTESYKLGWRRVKLYFMIGLPGEKEADLAEIPALVNKISGLRRETGGGPANVAVSVNAFIPKPHTALEREAMETPEILSVKRDLLKNTLRSKFAELSFHPIVMARMEAVFSRGDRRLSEAIIAAWRSGARFDGWQEIFNMDLWIAAFKDSGLDPDFYSSRKRPKDEVLPWDFIKV